MDVFLSEDTSMRQRKEKYEKSIAIMQRLGGLVRTKLLPKIKVSKLGARKCDRKPCELLASKSN